MTLDSLITYLKKRNLEAFAVALDQYLQVPGHTINDRDAYCKTILMYAAEIRYLPAVYFLLEHKADPNIENYNYNSALTFALDNFDYITTEALVHYGGNIQNLRSTDRRIGIYNVKEISKLFWSALRVMHKGMSVEQQAFGYTDCYTEYIPPYVLRKISKEVLDVVKQHNENLSKHPEVTSQAIAQQTLLYSPLAELVGSYLYADEALLADFKTLLFKGLNESNKKTKREREALEVTGAQESNQKNKWAKK